MPKEYKLQFKTFLKLLWVCGFALLYALGGIEYKFLRRFIAPIWLTSGMYLFSRDWRVFLQAPLQMLTLSMGYGADTFWAKIGRRALFAFANAETSLIHIFSAANWFGFTILLSLHNIFCISTIVILGVFNPLPARAEELIVGFIIGLIPMFMPKDKNDNPH